MGVKHPSHKGIPALAGLRRAHSGCVDARNVGVSPGETLDARYVGVSLGERIVAQKTGIPRARRIVNEYMLDYYYCIRSALVPILTRHSPCMKR